MKAIIKLNVRTFDDDVRTRVLAAIERIVNAEAKRHERQKAWDHTAGWLCFSEKRSRPNKTRCRRISQLFRG
jgi:metal-dependent amidase/aminoacylase/carboxypeptidase family protein